MNKKEAKRLQERYHAGHLANSTFVRSLVLTQEEQEFYAGIRHALRYAMVQLGWYQRGELSLSTLRHVIASREQKEEESCSYYEGVQHALAIVATDIAPKRRVHAPCYGGRVEHVSKFTEKM